LVETWPLRTCRNNNWWKGEKPVPPDICEERSQLKSRNRVAKGETVLYHDDFVPFSHLEWESLQRTTDFNGVPGFLGMKPSPYFTSLVSLDPEFDDPLLVNPKQRCIRPFDLNVVVLDKY